MQLLPSTKYNSKNPHFITKSTCPPNAQNPRGQKNYYALSPRHIDRRIGIYDDCCRGDALYHWQAMRQDRWPKYE